VVFKDRGWDAQVCCEETDVGDGSILCVLFAAKGCVDGSWYVSRDDEDGDFGDHDG